MDLTPKLLEELQKINVTLAAQSQQLAEHMRRTEAAEKRIDYLEKTVVRIVLTVCGAILVKLFL